MSKIREFLANRWNRRQFERKGFLNSRRKKDSLLGAFAERSKLTALLLLALVWLTSVAVLVMPGGQNQNFKLIERQLAPNTIYAHFDFSYEEPDLTAEARSAARSQVPLYYKIDAQTVERDMAELRDVFSEARKRGSAEKKGGLYSGVSSKAAELVGKLDRDAFSCVLAIADSPSQSKNFLDSFESVLNGGVISRAEKERLPWIKQIRVIDLQARVREPKAVKDIPTPQEAAVAMVEGVLEYYSHPRKPLIKQSLAEMSAELMGGGDIVFDRELGERKANEAAEQIKPIMMEIRKGQPIVVKDQEITRRDLFALKAYQSESELRALDTNLWRRFLESAAITLALMVMTGIYLFHIHPEVVRSNRAVWLMGAVTILALLSNYAFMDLFARIGALESLPPALLFQAMPLALATTLLSCLLGLRAALYAGFFVSIIAALAMDNSLSVALTGMIVSGVAGFAVRRATNYRTYFVRSFLAVSLATLLVGTLFLWKDFGAPHILQGALILPFVIGLVTAVMAEICIYFFEYVFDVSTDMSLLLLCDYNHPLLKRLQFEAPGSYHHSLLVSTLAEQAAQEIGANPIRARVCALFHDIGKLSQPEYFIENNVESENKHRELNPRMSSLIILNHVKEGVELARKYKLKRLIRDAIEQHHGTDLVYFFYMRAKEESSEPVAEQGFKYPGPLPREKEIAIVMLADCCEAASRSLQKPSHQKIDALVWEIFRKKIRDGQLDSAELTFKELAKIRKSFVKSLTTMAHGRISYPKDEEDDDEDDLFLASERLAQTQMFTIEEPGQKGG